MSRLLALPPFGPRNDAVLIEEMNLVTQHHWRGCPAFARVWPKWRESRSLEDFPFLHVGLFKRLALKTVAGGIHHQRILTSSATTGAQPSQIYLDERSSSLQMQSVRAIHEAWLGTAQRPLLILDDVGALRHRGQVSARLAAALSLQPLASEVHFILADAERPSSIRWDLLQDVMGKTDSVMMYGPTWSLWQSWGLAEIPSGVAERLHSVQIDYIHSGGWKKLDDMKVERTQFDSRLKHMAAPNSKVIDYYGLSEQTGLLFPLCDHGHRHVPLWSEVIVRNIETLEPVTETPGLLQFMNPLAWGAPYHNILTEDRGQTFAKPCACGLPGHHFELLGRLARAEVRGCGNV